MPHETNPGKGTVVTFRPIKSTSGAGVGSASLEVCGYMGMAVARKGRKRMLSRLPITSNTHS